MKRSIFDAPFVERFFTYLLFPQSVNREDIVHFLQKIKKNEKRKSKIERIILKKTERSNASGEQLYGVKDNSGMRIAF